MVFLWLVDLPLFKRNSDGRISTFHHPQMSPANGKEFLEAIQSGDVSRQLLLKGNGFELIVNGMELGGGNIRNNDIVIQKEILRACKVSEQSMKTTYKPLLDMLTIHPN